MLLVESTSTHTSAQQALYQIVFRQHSHEEDGILRSFQVLLQHLVLNRGWWLEGYNHLLTRSL
jgi:hypothetical protein